MENTSVRWPLKLFPVNRPERALSAAVLIASLTLVCLCWNALQNVKKVGAIADTVLSVHALTPRDAAIERRITSTIAEIQRSAYAAVAGVTVVIGLLVISLVAVARYVADSRDRALELNTDLETLVARRTAELKTAQSRYAALIENIPDVVWMAESVNRTPFVSRNVLRLTGYPADAYIMRGNELWVETIHPEDLPRILEAHRRLLTEAVPFDVEYRMRHREGRWVWVHDRALAVKEPDGRIWATGLCADITLRRDLEERLRDAQKMESIGKLAGGIAHDFNNILTGIMGSVELLRLRSDLDAQAQEDLSAVYSLGQRAAALVRQILDYSRRSRLETKPLDLQELVEGTLGMLRRTVPENVAITFEAKPGLFVVEGETSRLQQALTNLVVNSVDALPGGGRVRVQVERLGHDAFRPAGAPKGGEWITLTVEDTGCGIAPEDLPHVFEPFFTTKAPGKGTGLGLAQVYGIVKQMNGTVRAESSEGRGTTVSIYLPAAAIEIRSARTPDPKPAPEGRGETIVLVEDEPAVLKVGRRILESLGYRVVGFSSAESMLAELSKLDRLDLVITDMTMPGMSGRDLIERLREVRPELKAAIMSGYPLKESAGRASGRPIEWLQKPLSREKLGAAVERLLCLTS
jgi:two-component system, cell cycle sensor histidine kinase and response regulator CckA